MCQNVTEVCERRVQGLNLLLSIVVILHFKIKQYFQLNKWFWASVLWFVICLTVRLGCLLLNSRHIRMNRWTPDWVKRDFVFCASRLEDKEGGSNWKLCESLRCKRENTVTLEYVRSPDCMPDALEARRFNPLYCLMPEQHSPLVFALFGFSLFLNI